MSDYEDEAAERLIERIRAIVGRPEHASLAGVTGYDPMVPAVYWPRTWLVEAIREVCEKQVAEAVAGAYLACIHVEDDRDPAIQNEYHILRYRRKIELLVPASAQAALADHDAALSAAVREQCARIADNLVDEFDLPDGVSAAGARKAQRIAREIHALPLPDADRRDASHYVEPGGLFKCPACQMPTNGEPESHLPTCALRELQERYDERIRLEARLAEFGWWDDATYNDNYRPVGYKSHKAELEAALKKLK